MPGQKLLMNQSKTLEMEGIGRVLFEPSRRAKRLNVSVRPFKGVRVAVPRRTSFKKAREFVYSQCAWIRKQLGRIERMEKSCYVLSKKAASIDEAEAKKKIVNRLDELARLHGFAYNRVYVRNLKSRWGSCSHRNNISLNLKLIALPEEVLDYVILHELVHTRVKNHGEDFWQELERVSGDARALNLSLQQYNPMLLAA
jgi:predicted metal-dependent hydrolase